MALAGMRELVKCGDPKAGLAGEMPCELRDRDKAKKVPFGFPCFENDATHE
jgi:hypothetical protein